MIPALGCAHNADMGQPWPTVGLDDVAELRALLRRRDRAARQIGLALLRSWSVHDLGAIGSLAVLEASAGTYPSLPGDSEHPAEMLAQLLCQEPLSVPVADVVRVYVMAGERVRRALVHLLALRADDEGLDGLESILEVDASAPPAPVPTTELLAPLLDHPHRERVCGLLVDVLVLPGWAWHAAGLLVQLERRSPSEPATRELLMRRVESAATSLIDACNRGALRDRRSGDPARGERESLMALMALVDELAEQDQRSTLGAMLGSSDPRVAAMGAVRMVARHEPVAPERLGLIARDPVARADLHDGLRSVDADGAATLDPVSVAEGELVRWLSDVTELGRTPDEIEHVATVPARATGSAAVQSTPMASEPMHLFRFRMHAPHWSAARGWMIGAAGATAYSCYAAEDECAVPQHVTAILEALAEWPDRRADGAA